MVCKSLFLFQYMFRKGTDVTRLDLGYVRRTQVVAEKLSDMMVSCEHQIGSPRLRSCRVVGRYGMAGLGCPRRRFPLGPCVEISSCIQVAALQWERRNHHTNILKKVLAATGHVNVGNQTSHGNRVNRLQRKVTNKIGREKILNVNILLELKTCWN